MTAPVKVEVVVVGSGASGSLIASRMAQAGKQTLILEAGPERGMRNLVSSQLWARRLKWGGSPVIEDGKQPIGYNFNAGWGVGGSAMHHYGVWPRLHEEDFDMKSRYGKGLDWPIGYDELRPHYDRVQKEVGVSGDAKAEVWRPAGDPYPMKPVPLFEQGRILARGFAALDMQTAPLPLAVTSEAYDGRAPCIWDGWCDAGCPIGALANPLATYLPRAEKAGAVLKANATVTRVLSDRAGKRALGVEYVTRDGTRIEQHADVVVLAAFTVQNPRLLLASGLANSSGRVGQYMMTHPAGLVYGMFDEYTENHMGATGGQLLCQDGYGKNKHSNKTAFGSYQWMIAPAVKPNDLLGFGTTRGDLFGAGLHDFMKQAARGFANMTAAVEDLPVASNRLVLSGKKDEHGVPLAHVTHTADEQTVALWEHALEEGQEVFKAAGAKTTWTGPMAAMHILGGTIMGDDPEQSVVNSYGQTHDIANLFIAGPGLFPSSGGVNPTFTVNALASRSSDYLLGEWGSIV